MIRFWCIHFFHFDILLPAPSFWREQAKHDFNEVLSNVGRTLGKADNVICFLGDGMGVATVTTARILKGQMNGNHGEETVLNMEKFPHVALSKVCDSLCPSFHMLCNLNIMLPRASTRDAGVLRRLIIQTHIVTDACKCFGMGQY